LENAIAKSKIVNAKTTKAFAFMKKAAAFVMGASAF